MTKIFYSPEDVSKMFHITVKQVYQYIQDKKIKPCYRVAGRLNIPEHAIEKFKEKHKGGRV